MEPRKLKRMIEKIKVLANKAIFTTLRRGGRQANKGELNECMEHMEEIHERTRDVMCAIEADPLYGRIDEEGGGS